MTEPIPTSKELQKLCEELIACPHLKVYKGTNKYGVYDPSLHEYVLDITREPHSFLWPFCWSNYSIELAHVAIAVNNPRKLYRLAKERYNNLAKNETVEEINKAICFVTKYLSNEYRKEKSND